MKNWLFFIIFGLFLTGCSEATEISSEKWREEEKKEVASIANGEKTETEKKEMPSLTFTMDVNNWTFQSTEETEQKYVLITIDDAPDTYAVEMAHILAEREVPAIFFVNGHLLSSEEGREALKEIAALGFEIGNHTMTHANLNELTFEETEEEILPLNKLIEGITGEKPRFFRAPFGLNTDFSKEILAREEITWMNWTYGYDWENEFMEKEALAEIMVNTEHLTDGANLLMHDRKWTKEALPLIIDGLRDKGYEFIDPDAIENFS